MPAICGVTVTLGWVQSGWSAGKGSVWNTSSTAPAQMAAVQRRDQIFLAALTAAAHIHHPGAFGQPCEQFGVHDALGLRRQRQHADQDIAIGQEDRQFLRPGIAGNARHLLAAAAPAEDLEVEHQQPLGRHRADIAQTQDADAQFARWV